MNYLFKPTATIVIEAKRSFVNGINFTHMKAELKAMKNNNLPVYRVWNMKRDTYLWLNVIAIDSYSREHIHLYEFSSVEIHDCLEYYGFRVKGWD